MVLIVVKPEMATDFTHLAPVSMVFFVVVFFRGMRDVRQLLQYSFALPPIILRKSMDWMRRPAPKQGGLTRDELCADCILSAWPITGIEIMGQKNTTKPAGWVGRSAFYLCLLSCSHRVA